MSKKTSKKRQQFFCEHYDAQEHIGDCPRCQKILDTELNIGRKRMKDLIIARMKSEIECTCNYAEAYKYIPSKKGLVHNRNCKKRVFEDLIKKIKTLK